MIVTLDTGVLVRATARADGPAHRLLGILVSDPEHTVVLSSYILAEVGKALSYDQLYDYYKLTPDDIQQHVDFLSRAVEIVDPIRGISVTLTDPHDDPVFYTAITAGANVLCCRDKAFYQPNVVALAARHDLFIMNEVQLLALLESRH